MWRITSHLWFFFSTLDVHDRRSGYCMMHVCKRWRESFFIVCVWVWVHRYAACLINVCVSHKLQSQWLDWCNDSSNGKYSSGDCRRPKTINVCIRFIKWNPCTKRLHLVLFHHSVLKLGEVLSKHMLIENHWTLIYLSNKSFYPPSVSFRHHSNAGNKQQKKKVVQTSSPTEPNPANHVWVSRLFFHFLSTH